MTDQAQQLEAIRAPFPPGKINQIPKGGTTLDYVGHAELTDRLLELDPLWTWEPLAFDEDGLPKVRVVSDGKIVELWIRLTFAGVTRIGVGTCESRKFEVSKELIGDALRNAAMRFGAALDLWAKSDLHDAVSPPVEADVPYQAQPVEQPAPDSRAVKIVELMTDASDDVKAAWKKANGDNPHRITDSDALDRALAHAEALVAGGDFVQPVEPVTPAGPVDGDGNPIHPDQGTLEGAA